MYKHFFYQFFSTIKSCYLCNLVLLVTIIIYLKNKCKWINNNTKMYIFDIYTKMYIFDVKFKLNTLLFLIDHIYSHI